jgi:hypothetical protein
MFLLYIRVPYARTHQAVWEYPQDVRLSLKRESMDLIAALPLTMCYVAHGRRNCRNYVKGESLISCSRVE